MQAMVGGKAVLEDPAIKAIIENKKRILEEKGRDYESRGENRLWNNKWVFEKEDNWFYGCKNSKFLVI